MKSKTYTLLDIEPPTTVDAAIPWTMSLSAAGDAASGDEMQAVIRLGDAVQAGALMALATAPDGMTGLVGLLPLSPDDAGAWLASSGELADSGACFIATGEAVPILARLLMMECTPELAELIQAKMG
jgi:hypothetical protein